MNTPYLVAQAIRGRLGGRFDTEDTDFDAYILAELNNAQFFMEQGPVYPSFLLTPTPLSLDCATYSGSAALPADFLVEDEYTPPAYYTASGTEFQRLRKKPYGQIRFMTTAGTTPTYYCLYGETIKWANPPTTGTIKFWYKARQDLITSIASGAAGNYWYGRAGNCMMTRAAFVLASSYLKDQVLAGLLQGEFAAAYRQLEALEIQRESEHFNLGEENEYGS